MATVVVHPPWQGMDLSTGAGSVSKSKGITVNNLLTGYQDKLLLRGPIGYGETVAADTNMPGFWPNGGRVLFVKANDKFQRVDLTVGAGAVGPEFNAPVVGMRLSQRYVVHGAYTFGIGVTGAGLPNNIMRWDGTEVAGGAVMLANAPTGTDLMDVASWLGRLVVLGGTPPGGGASSPRRLYWTDPGYTGTDVLNDWRDDVSGLINQLELPTDIHTLLPIHNSMYLLGWSGIYVLSGSAPENWSVSLATTTRCEGTAPLFLRSAIELNGTIYFATTTGVSAFDGVETRDLTYAVRDRFAHQYISGPYTELGGIGISSIDSHTLTVTVRDQYWFLYDLATGAWSLISSAKFTPNSMPRWLGWTHGRPSVPFFATPTAVECGSAIPATAMIPSHPGTDDASISITGTASTAQIPLATPPAKAVLQRVYVDYYLQYPGAPANPPYIKVDIRDETATVFATTTLSASFAGRQRAVLEVHTEIDAARVFWTIETLGTAFSRIELLDVTLEYVPAQPR